jgi:S1-C subfamily serine protease
MAAAGAAPLKGTGGNPVLYAVLGVGGAAVALLLVVLAVVLSRGNGEPARGRGAAVAEAPAPKPVEPEPAPVRATPAVTPTIASASSYSSSSNSALDPAEVVRRLKDATVYIKNKVGGRALASGSGFVIEVHGDTCIVATNRHVAVLDVSELPARLVPKGAKVELEAVFRSGLGPQQEQALPAEIIAADLSGDFTNDLAFLVVRGVQRPPTPINVSAKSDTTEGMAYTGAGFPFGGFLTKINESKSNPSVTITRGGIARLVRDDYGQLDLFQVDGSLQPGNSGGPIVEERTGKFIGVVVAKMGAVDTIGFVVPAEEVRRTLAGRVGALDLTLKAIESKNADLQIKAQIVDPKGTVKDVMVQVVAASAGKVSPNGDGTWPPLPNSTSVTLERDPNAKGTASGRVQLSLSGEGAAARKILIQTAHKDMSGKLVYSKPREIELPEKPGRVMASNYMMQVLKTIQRKTFAMLGDLVDPEKDCKLVKDDEHMTIKIEVPGGKVRSLAPYVLARSARKRPIHNAPMTLIEVEGDFAALVEVTGEMTPGSTLPKDRQGNIIPFTFQGGGLLLYQNKENFIRLERTAGVAVETLAPIHKVLFEVVKDGKHVENQNYPPVPEGPVYLLLMRRKGRVWCGASLNLGTPPVPIQEVEMDFPKKLKIGLSASNISAKQYTATFENFALINDETQMEAMFGEPESPKKKEK